MNSERPFAIITGASSGIGFELAKRCVEENFDVLIASEEAEINDAAARLRGREASVEALVADLSTREGVDKLVGATRGRKVDALIANAGRGLGRAFLDQDFDEVRNVIDTNITGTVYLVQKIAREMRQRKSGRILITGSIAGFMPGSFQAVYNGTKAFLDSFSFALRNELQDDGVSVTCLMPGATDTEFFQRADMMDTKVATSKKDDPADVARDGFNAMMNGDGDIVSGFKNKVQAAVAHITPSEMLASMHRKMAEPGTAK